MRNESFTIITSDGIALASDRATPEDAPRGVAVVCHPHPLYGGDRRNNVVDTLFRTLPMHGIATIRFDFRGAGGSGGSHGSGIDELLDVAAAVDVAAADALPIVLIGYSFGALMALDTLDPRITAWVGVAPPLGTPLDRLDATGADPRHKLLLVAEHDQYAPPAKVAERVAGWTNCAAASIPMADHFLNGHLSFVAGQVAAFVDHAVGGTLPT